MESLLAETTHVAALWIEAMAAVVVAYGSIEAFVSGIRVMLLRRATSHERRKVWLRYASWLVAGLTFQLAADLLHTAIAPTWEDVGRLGAIALIRTFLNYFLERDMEEVRRRQDAPDLREPA